jgi:hypothetical protein
MKKVANALNFLLHLNVSHILVLCLVGKALVSDVSYAAFLITVPVLAYESYKLFIKSKKPDPIRLSEEVRQELSDMRSKLSALHMEKGVKTPVTRYF